MDDTNSRQMGASDSPSSDLTSAGGSIRVLLVEDQVELRALLSDVLQDAGMEVRIAEDAHSAKAILEDFPCDVLVSDVHMPGSENGIDLAEHLKRSRPQARVILASGHPPRQLPSLPGYAHFLQKPFRLNQLMQLLAA